MTQQTVERVAQLERENELLRLRLDRLEHEVRSMRPVVQQVKKLRIWDFTPYGVQPDGSWVAVDRTCAAEAQGPTRYARGMNYLFMLEQRHPNLVRHRILSIWSVGHDAASMFMSACGLAALFDRPGCTPF